MKILLKAIHRRALTYINSWLGFTSIILIVSGLLLVSLNGIFNPPSASILVSPLPITKSIGLYDFSDNIGNIDLESILAFGPVDVVYTWVNGSDPAWLKKKEFFTKIQFPVEPSNISASDNITLSNTTNSNDPEDDTNSNNRYRDSNELKYSLRSIEKNAPWVRKIYIVTDNQVPSWLNLENDRISIVPHEDIFLNKSHLPVFSSPAIESHLHRIPGLSKKFIYFNDDVFLGTKVTPEDFVTISGAQKFYLSWDVPKCAPGCADSWIGDGYCDAACNVSSCNFDFPDCINGTNANRGASSGSANARANPQCISGCPDNWLADKVCDMRCKHEECGWDVGDCGIDKVTDAYPGIMLTPSMVKLSKKFVNSSATDITTSQSPLTHNISDSLEDDDNVPVAMTIPSGIKAVYLNVSFLQCQSLDMGLRSECNVDILVPEFSYTFAEFVDGPIVHVAVLLTKFRLLVLVLYNGQENAPDYPQLPFDTKLRVGGYNALTNVHVNATFQLRVENISTVPDVVDSGIPSSMGAVSGYVGTCSPVRVNNKKGLRASGEVSKLIPVDHVSLLSKPFAHAHIYPTNTSHSRQVASVGVDAGSKYVDQDGIVLDILLPRVASLPTSLLDRNINAFSLLISMTLLNEATTYWGKVPLSFLIGQVNTTNLSIHQLYQSSLSSDALTSIHPSLVDVLLSQAAAPSYSKLISKLDPLQNIKNNLREASNHVVIPDTELPVPLLLLIPVPFPWLSLENSSWVQFQISMIDTSLDITIESNNTNPIVNTTKSAITHNSFWNEITLTESSEHNHVGSAQIHRQTRLHRYLCFSGSFKWGNIRYATSDVSLIHADLNLTQSTGPGNNSDVDLLDGSNATTARRLISGELDWGIMERKMFGSNVIDMNRNKVVGNDVIQGTRILRKVHGSTIPSNKHRRLHSSSQDKPIKLMPLGLKPSLHENLQSMSVISSETINPVDVDGSGSSYFNMIAKTLRRLADSIDQWLNSENANSRDVSLPLSNTVDHDHRRLEDTYASSLIYVNRLYNKAFGTDPSTRKVPAHMPHMIDKEVVDEMQQKWKEEWMETSTHRFRSSHDMQYSFSYYYYAMNRNKAVNKNILVFIQDEVDSNRDGFIDKNEFRTLMKLTTPQKGLQGQEYEDALLKCVEDAMIQLAVPNTTMTSDVDSADDTNSSTVKDAIISDIDTTSNHHNSGNNNINSQSFHGLSPVEHAESIEYSVASGEIEIVSKSFHVKKRPSNQAVAKCPLVIEGIKANIDWSLYSPTHTIGSENNVAFEMIGDNYTNTLQQLDSIRARRAKFICVNDNMQNPSKELEEVLRTFFESFFPIPSQFELPEDISNPTLHLDEYLQLRKEGKIKHGRRKFDTVDNKSPEPLKLPSKNALNRLQNTLLNAWQSLKSIGIDAGDYLLDDFVWSLRQLANRLQPPSKEDTMQQTDNVQLLQSLRTDVSHKPKLPHQEKPTTIQVKATSRIGTSSGTMDGSESASSYKYQLFATKVGQRRYYLSFILFFILMVGCVFRCCFHMSSSSSSASHRSQGRLLDIEGKIHARRVSDADNYERHVETKHDSKALKKAKNWGWIKHSVDGSVDSSDGDDNDDDDSSDSEKGKSSKNTRKVIRVARGDTLEMNPVLGRNSMDRREMDDGEPEYNERNISLLNSDGPSRSRISGVIGGELLSNLISSIQSVPSVASAAVSAASSMLSSDETSASATDRRDARVHDEDEDDGNDGEIEPFDRREFFIYNYSEAAEYKDMWVGRGSFRGHRPSGTPKKSLRWHSSVVGYGDPPPPLRHRVATGIYQLVSRVSSGSSQAFQSKATLHKEKHSKAV